MTRKALPKLVSLDIDAPEFTPGLVGLIEAAAVAIRHQDAEIDLDELLAISSVAFTSYVYDPEYNLHEEEPLIFSPLGELFSNYGPWASIGFYTGWQLREVNGLPPVDLMKIVAFELSQGRSIVSLDGSLKPTILRGYEVGIDKKDVSDIRGRHWDIDAEKLQADSEVFSNWILLVRPGEPEEWVRTIARQRMDVLRWAADHGRNRKEFFQETRENYVPGVKGIAHFRAFLDGLTEPAAVEFAEEFVARMQRARKAAALVLPRWIDSIVEALENESVRPHLEEAAQHYQASSEALSSYTTLVDAFEAVEAAETAALDALEKAADFFPSAFEA